VESMMLTGKPVGTVERTLMTSGLLDALLQSCADDGRRRLTPQLEFGYQTSWRWKQPPPPPPGRPWAEQ